MFQPWARRIVPLLIAGVAIVVAALLQPITDRAWPALMLPALVAAAWWGGWPLGLFTLAIGIAGRTVVLESSVASRPVWLGTWLLVHFAVVGGVALAATARKDHMQTRRIQREQATRSQQAVAARRQAFLAHASEVLGSSSDYEATLSAVANLAVPQIADLCVVDILQKDGSFGALAVAHVDPAKIQLVRELRRMYPLDPKAPFGPPRVLRTGHSVVHEELSDGSTLGSMVDPAETRVATALGIKSSMAVPLLIGGRRLGVISFATTESARRFVPADLRFAEDLARRAAIAADAARP